MNDWQLAMVFIYLAVMVSGLTYAFIQIFLRKDK